MLGTYLTLHKEKLTFNLLHNKQVVSQMPWVGRASIKATIPLSSEVNGHTGKQKLYISTIKLEELQINLSIKYGDDGCIAYEMWTKTRTDTL